MVIKCRLPVGQYHLKMCDFFQQNKGGMLSKYQVPVDQIVTYTRKIKER
jgi:hypothetical protein